MNYNLSFSNKVSRIIKKLPKTVSDVLYDGLKKIAADPHIGEKLSGVKGVWRYRIGDYRVLYEIHDRQLLIYVINFGHRKEIYRDL